MSISNVTITELNSKVKLIIREMLEIERELSLDDDLFENGLSSLTSIRLVVKLEEEFGMEFDDEELLIENFSTLRQIITKVKSKLGNNGV